MIFLVRHGETDWSQAGKHTGLTDISINEKGKAQALHLKTVLERHTFTRVFSSPLKRAHETCLIAGYSDATIDPDLVEWNYGKYEGLTTEEIHKTNPNWNLFKDGAPAGETLDQIAQRAQRMLAKIKKEKGDVLLFSSAHFLRTFTACYLGLTAHEGRLFLFFPASISILAEERGAPVILQWNLKTL